MVDGTEYEDGDTVVVKGGASNVYIISVADENYENATATLTGETDKDGNDIIAVSGNRFSVISSGKLTITVTVPDTDLEKTITLNFKVETSIDLKDKDVAMSYTGGTGAKFSDEYKALVEETKIFPGTKDEDGKDMTADKAFELYGIENGDFDKLWAVLEGKMTLNLPVKNTNGDSVSTNTTSEVRGAYLKMGVGDTVTLTGFTKYNTTSKTMEKYDTTDTVEYVSENSSIVAVDRKTGVITAKQQQPNENNPIKIMIFVNGDYVAYCEVQVSGENDSISFSANDGTTEYANLGGETMYSGTYSTEVRAGESQAASLYAFRNEFQNKDAIQSVSLKTANGKAPNVNSIMIDGTDVYYFYDANTGNLYYVITNETGVGSFKVALPSSSLSPFNMKVLDADQYKENAVVPAGALTVEINGVKATDRDTKTNPELNAYLEEGQVLNIADIASVEGVDSANVAVSVSDNANVTYKAVQGTITAGKFTDDNFNNAATVTISYGDKVKDPDNYREVVVNVTIVNPVAVKNDADVNGGTIYAKSITTEVLSAVTPALSKAVDKDGNADVTSSSLVNDGTPANAWTYSVDNEDMVTVAKDGSKIDLNSDYKAKAGDKVTITATHAQGYTVSWTIEIVEKDPAVGKYRLANTTMTIANTETSIKSRAFDSLIEATDVPSGCTVGFTIVGNADGVDGMYYVDADGVAQNGDSSVDASAIKLVEEDGGLYTLSGFRTAAYSTETAGKSYAIKVKPVVYDANGIVIAEGTTEITLTITYAATVVGP